MSAVMPRAHDALMPREPEGMGRGLMLAIAVHIGLVIALAIGVHWRSREPETMAAELWSAVPQVAAPKAVEPEPPKPAPEPPKPQPAPPVPKVETPPPRDADIAVEKARREKQLQREREELERQQQEAEKRAAAEKKAAAEKAARERQQQLEAEQRRKEAEQQRRQAAQLAAAREAQMKRIMGLAGASGDANATGQALKSSGPSASYAGRIRARIKPNIVFTDDVPGNPTATVEIRLAPDGTIVGTPRLVKSSGAKAWDDAVVRAVVKTGQLPRDVDGTVPPSMVITFRPHE